MRSLIWNAFALSVVWNFMFEDDCHFIVSKRGREVLR